MMQLLEHDKVNGSHFFATDITGKVADEWRMGSDVLGGGELIQHTRGDDGERHGEISIDVRQILDDVDDCDGSPRSSEVFLSPGIFALGDVVDGELRTLRLLASEEYQHHQRAEDNFSHAIDGIAERVRKQEAAR